LGSNDTRDIDISLEGPITISIVTPSYNQGQYLEETIQSVITQSGDFMVEYVVMDGGSTDNSIYILKRYEEAIKSGEFKPSCLGLDFRWVSEKDRGQTHAINKGFQTTRGEIVSWINSDDIYCDNAFSIVAEHFQKHPESDFLFGDGEVIDETGKLQWEWLSRPYDFKILKSYHYLWNDFTNYIMQQAAFWKKGVFEKVGLLDESLHYAMDIEYWLRIGNAGLRAVHIPAKIGKFRMVRGTKSLSTPTVFWFDQLEIFRRYNGARAMEPFLRYYFYNEGLHRGVDVDVLAEKRRVLLETWKSLEEIERSTLAIRSKRAMTNATLMLAYEALLQGESKKATSIFKRAIAQRPLSFFSYLSFWFLLNKLLGTYLSKVLKKNAQKVIRSYRMGRYLYRYP
jgi:glycosyltransferase involved in cell wall biosynthesis